VTPDGNPVTANSLSNQVGLVTVEDGAPPPRPQTIPEKQ